RHGEEVARLDPRDVEAVADDREDAVAEAVPDDAGAGPRPVVARGGVVADEQVRLRPAAGEGAVGADAPEVDVFVAHPAHPEVGPRPIEDGVAVVAGL